jgi:hypothetical protein
MSETSDENDMLVQGCVGRWYSRIGCAAAEQKTGSPLRCWIYSDLIFVVGNGGDFSYPRIVVIGSRGPSIQAS